MMTQVEMEASVRSVSRKCKGKIRFFHGKPLMRSRCGYDVNNLIVHEPFDGQERTLTCPKCGQQIKITSPYFI